KEHDPGLPGEQQRDLELALLAVGEGAGGDTGPAGEPDPVQDLVRLGGDETLRPQAAPQPHRAAAAGLYREPDVLRHRQGTEDRRGLEGATEAQPRAAVRGESGDVDAVEQDCAGGR